MNSAALLSGRAPSLLYRGSVRNGEPPRPPSGHGWLNGIPPMPPYHPPPPHDAPMVPRPLPAPVQAGRRRLSVPGLVGGALLLVVGLPLVVWCAVDAAMWIEEDSKQVDAVESMLPTALFPLAMFGVLGLFLAGLGLLVVLRRGHILKDVPPAAPQYHP